MSIEVSHVSKRYRSFTALDDVSLTIPSGELVALLGPSGCGKTTLLRIIAGLEVPDAGTILFNGNDATGVHARERNVGFVFQHYALFRHMSVFENVAFGLRVKPRAERPSESAIRERVNELLELVQLDRLAHRYPDQLSGGQRQRVALARALAVRPAVLLLDEPFGALDAKVRKELRRWIRQLHEEIHVTSVFVTHDQEEALEVADRVVVMNRGRVEQVGSPDEVYEHPASPFVFQFLGDVNLFHARVESGRAFVGDAEFRLDHREVQDGVARIYIRPHEMEVSTGANGKDGIRALVREVRPMGPMVRVSLASCADGETMEAQLPRESADAGSLAPGNVVYVRPRNMRVFDSGGALD